MGVVHHNIFYSPVASTKVAPTKNKTVVQAQNSNIVKKKITKATEKRLLAKAANAETKQKALVTSTKQESTRKNSNKVKSNSRKSFASPNHKFNPPAGLLKISLSREDDPLNENNTFAHDKLTDNQEPFRCNSDSIEAITLKVSSDEETSDSSRRKQTNSMVKSILNDSNVKSSQLEFSVHTAKEKENCSKDVISLPNCLNNFENNIKRNKQENSDLCQASDLSDQTNNLITKTENSDASTGKKYSIEYFKDALDKERNRLQELCEEWTKIQLQDDITEDIRYQINQAVGQTTMLIKEKFKQFHSLIMDCERNDGDVLVTCMDLHGFWDMIYIEVKDCDSRFAKLKRLRARCWQEDQSSFVKSEEKIVVTKKKVISARKSSLGLILSDKKKKITKDNEKNSQEIVDMNNDKCITPSITNKRAVNVFRKSSDASCNKKCLETSSNCTMYTSTPLPVKATSNISNQLCTPLITMKVSQLYNKSMMLNGTTLHMTPEGTPTNSSIEKVEKSRNKSLGINLAHKVALNDHLTMTKSSDEKLEVDQDSGASLKKINKYDELNVNENIHIEGKSDSGIDGSVQTTIIEKTINGNNNTLKLSSHSADSIKTPIKSKRSVEESSSKSLKITLFGTSSSHLIVESPVGISTTINISPTSHNSSLIHDSRNISSKAASTNREPKKCNSSEKRALKETNVLDMIR